MKRRVGYSCGHMVDVTVTANIRGSTPSPQPPSQSPQTTGAAPASDLVERLRGLIRPDLPGPKVWAKRGSEEAMAVADTVDEAAAALSRADELAEAAEACERFVEEWANGPAEVVRDRNYYPLPARMSDRPAQLLSDLRPALSAYRHARGETKG